MGIKTSKRIVRRSIIMKFVKLVKSEHKFDKKSSSQRYTVEREDWGKSDIYEGERDRMFYIYDNIENEPVSDGMGETIYYDNLEEAEFECEELNYSESEHKFDKKSRNLTRSERHNKMMNGIF